MVSRAAGAARRLFAASESTGNNGMVPEAAVKLLLRAHVKLRNHPAWRMAGRGVQARDISSMLASAAYLFAAKRSPCILGLRVGGGLRHQTCCMQGLVHKSALVQDLAWIHRFSNLTFCFQKQVINDRIQIAVGVKRSRKGES